MRIRKTLVTLLGVAAGVWGVRLAAEAYRKGKKECPPFGKRIYHSTAELIGDFGIFWREPERLLAARRNPAIDPVFAEKIMLAVTGVNGCRYCSYAHLQTAKRLGLTPQQVASLLKGEIEQANVDEAPALFFAQHYAETRGQPEDDILERLIDAYGPETARDIITSIRMISMANLIGNTFDALVSRLLGKPAPDSTLAGELSVLGTAAFGLASLAAVLGLRMGLGEPSSQPSGPTAA